MANIKRQDLIKYVTIAILLVLTSFTKFSDNMLPLSMSMYIALIYCKMNFAVISPLYLLSCLFVGQNIAVIIYALLPIAIMGIIKIILKYSKVDIKMFVYIIAQAICYLPYIFISKDIKGIIYSVSIGLVYTYVFMISMYALIVREKYFALSLDEKTCSLLLLVALSFSIYSINIVNVRPFYALIGFLIIAFMYKLNISTAIGILSALCIGAGIYCLDIGILGGCIIPYFSGYIFKRVNKYMSLSATVLSFIACQVVFNANININYLDIGAFFIGTLAFTLIPNKIQNKILNTNKGGSIMCAENILKRDKLEIVRKLNTAESVIYEMAEGYITKSSFLKREEIIASITKEVVFQCCGVCESRENCFKSLNISPETALRDLIDNALITKCAKQNDVPLSLRTRCKNVPNMLSITNTVIRQYISKIENQKQIENENRFFSMQMAGIGSILGSITKELKEFPLIDEKLEEELKAELGYNGILCKEALFMLSKDRNSVMLIVQKTAKDKECIVQIASKLLKDSLIKKDEEMLVDANMVCIYLESKPKYDIAFSNIVISKNGSMYCGDAQSIVKIKDSKVLLVLCDGMGTGEKAQQTSQKTLSLVQDFYKAGLDNSKSLTLINKALTCINQESFTAVDMCVVDLSFASVDFIKLGAMPSFIKRKEGVFIVNSGALPLGIIDSARPNITREVLTTNDIVVLVSDGILDVLKIEGIKEILIRLKSTNPKTICEEIVGQAKTIGLLDDASIIAFNIYKKV